jgi:hypothetical protein
MRGRRRFWAVLAACLAPAACALDWAFVPPPDAAAADGGLESSASEASKTEAAVADGAPAEGAAIDAAVNVGCNSLVGGCEAGSFCHFPDHLCGTGGPGVCTPTTQPCSSSLEVCTCEGWEPSECVADTLSQDLSVQSTCILLGPEYQCGWAVCDRPFFCVRQTVAGEVQYSCQSEPSCTNGCTGCSMPGCTCVTLDGGWEFDCP